MKYKTYGSVKEITAFSFLGTHGKCHDGLCYMFIQAFLPLGLDLIRKPFLTYIHLCVAVASSPYFISLDLSLFYFLVSCIYDEAFMNRAHLTTHVDSCSCIYLFALCYKKTTYINRLPLPLNHGSCASVRMFVYLNSSHLF